jgi:hypothetical protein
MSNIFADLAPRAKAAFAARLRINFKATYDSSIIMGGINEELNQYDSRDTLPGAGRFDI